LTRGVEAFVAIVSKGLARIKPAEI